MIILDRHILSLRLTRLCCSALRSFLLLRSLKAKSPARTKNITGRITESEIITAKLAKTTETERSFQYARIQVTDFQELSPLRDVRDSFSWATCPWGV